MLHFAFMNTADENETAKGLQKTDTRRATQRSEKNGENEHRITEKFNSHRRRKEKGYYPQA